MCLSNFDWQSIVTPKSRTLTTKSNVWFSREREGVCFYQRWFVCLSMCVCVSVWLWPPNFAFVGRCTLLEYLSTFHLVSYAVTTVIVTTVTTVIVTLSYKSKSSKTRDHEHMANRRKKMTVPPTRMTVKTMAQMRLSTAAANCQSFFISSSFKHSSSDGDGNCFMQRHAANFSQKRLFICYVKQRNSYILPQSTVDLLWKHDSRSFFVWPAYCFVVEKRVKKFNESLAKSTPS